MERASVLCLLLLLLGSLSGADRQDNEITEQREAGPESANAVEPIQLHQTDIHEVLRDMSAKLAKHEVRIEHLQTLNEQLQTLNKEQAARLSELEGQADSTKLQLQVHTASLKSVENTLDSTTHQVEALNRDKTAGKVAFSAGFLESGNGYFGPFDRDTTLEFKTVFSNIGNAYNPNTGFFIAPVRGAYHFEFYAGTGGSDEHASAVGLRKNGEHIVLAYEHQTNGYGSTGNGATLLLEAGDAVCLVLSGNNAIYDKYHRCTFSGHLLFLM